jgi:hypothetical protein
MFTISQKTKENISLTVSLACLLISLPVAYDKLGIGVVIGAFFI